MIENAPEIVIALKYLSDNGGKDIVKKAAGDFYDWVKVKLNPKGKERLESLKGYPDDEKTQQEVKKSLEAAQEAELISSSEFQQQADNFTTILKEHDPQWYEKMPPTIKQNIQNIAGKSNVGIQDSTNSSISINQNKAE